MQCNEVMLSYVYKVHPEDPVVLVAQTMKEQKLGFVPVVDEKDVPVGVVTDRDLALRVIAEKRPYSVPVSDVMTRGPFVTCHPEDDLRTVEERLGHGHKSRAMVVDPHGKLVGVISLSDIAEREPNAERARSLFREVAHRESVQLTRH